MLIWLRVSIYPDPTQMQMDLMPLVTDLNMGLGLDPLRILFVSTRVAAC